MSYEYEELLDRFVDPPAAYRPMMFWIWNGALDRERIVQQVQDIADAGCGGFFIHPMGESFRLHDFIRGISPGYLTEGYFEAVRWAVEAADEAGIYAWLYDEGGWPSGTAQGAVLDGHPEYSAGVLSQRTLRAAGGARVAVPQGSVAAVARFADRAPMAVELTAGEVEAPTDAVALSFYIVGAIEGRVDLMNPAAVRRFIDVTHERYAEAVGDYFGDVVPGIFTDEPALPGRVGSGQIPWTEALPGQFEARRGYDLRPYLPALFPEDPEIEAGEFQFAPTVAAQVRCEFCDLWTDLYKEAYWEQINDWCEEHDLIHTGHVGGEDNLLDHGRHGFGHYFRTAGALHAPGVDAIWRQLHWDKDNFDFTQLAASAARQKPMGTVPEGAEGEFGNLTVSETNGVYGLGLTFEQMRWLVDYHCMGGITMICPMSYTYETGGGGLFRTQDHIGPNTPQWEMYDGFSEYVGRLCAVMRSGVGLADVAVYYPIEAVWADSDGEAAEAAWHSLKQVTQALREEQVAFDYLDADTIRDATVSEGILETTGEFYGTVIVPITPCLPADVLNQLAALYESGGRVAFCRGVPGFASELEGGPRCAEALALLRDSAVTMDAEAEADLPSGDELRDGIDEQARFDGLTAGFGIPRDTDRFAAAVWAEKAVLVVPREEVGRLGRLMALRTGRFGIQPSGVIPHLRMTVRDLAPMQVALLMNDGSEPLTFELDVISDRPGLLERWDPADGKTLLLALHREVSEMTRVRMHLRGNESALVVLRPAEEETTLRAAAVAPGGSIVLADLHTPDSVEVVASYEIVDGDLTVTQSPRFAQVPCRLGEWGELGLADLSGAIAYEFGFVVAEEYLSAEVMLDLGEVCYAARVLLNEEELPSCLWPPYAVDVSGLLVAGANRLRITVANTMANQAASERVVAEARSRGWFNGYYERALPMMQETLRSGLIGPVRLLLAR
jgi:hypothetical protein